MIQSLIIANRGTSSILPELCSGRGTARRSRGVEGQARGRRAQDMRHHRVEFAQHISRRDAQCLDSVFGKKRVSPRISRSLRLETMSLAIDFDAQTGFGAVEIENVRPRRMLATKFQPVRASTKLRPQGHFGERERAAKLACSSNRLARFAQHSACPSTMLCMVPLPKPSLGRILRTHP